MEKAAEATAMEVYQKACAELATLGAENKRFFWHRVLSQIDQFVGHAPKQS